MALAFALYGRGPAPEDFDNRNSLGELLWGREFDRFKRSRLLELNNFLSQEGISSREIADATGYWLYRAEQVFATTRGGKLAGLKEPHWSQQDADRRRFEERIGGAVISARPDYPEWKEKQLSRQKRLADAKWAFYEAPRGDAEAQALRREIYRLRGGMNAAGFPVPLEDYHEVAKAYAKIPVVGAPADAISGAIHLYYGENEQAAWVAVGLTVDVISAKAITDLAPEVKLHGAGPATGMIEVSPRVNSIKVFQQNTKATKSGREFILDPDSDTFVLATKSDVRLDALSPHERLADSIGKQKYRRVVGGTLNTRSGDIETGEFSGHYGHNWSPEVREQFVEFMESMGIKVNHHPFNN